MNAVIMAGGFGTRLRPITCNIPKPMVPVANIPMMEHIVNLLKKYDLTRIVSILYFQPEQISKYFGDGSNFGVQMDYVMATADYGTAGSVKNSESYLKNNPFIIISGDVLTDFDLSAAIEYHREKKAMATIVLTRVPNPLEYGVVITSEDGKIIRFLEKPSWGEVFSDTINTGIYILEPEIFQYIPPQTEFDFSKNLFPLMLKEKLPLYGYIADGYWRDIGDINEYRLAHKNVLDGNVQINVPGNRLNMIGRDVYVGEASKVGPKVKLKGGVIIGANCVVEDGAELSNTILGDGCIVRAGAKIADSVIWDRVFVGPKAKIDEAIITWDTQIMDGAVLEKGVIIAEECRIGEGAVVRKNVMIWPRKIVEDGSTVYSSIVWSDKWTRNLFTNFHISGLANLEITPELGSKVGAAFGSILPKGASVNTSRDGHKVTRMVNRALICGLLSSGINVSDLQVTPTPVARYKPRVFGRSGGIHVSQSTEDPNHIEITIFDSEGRDLLSNQQKSIEKLFNREDFRRVMPPDIGDITFPSRISEHYRDELMAHVEVESIRKKNIKVVVDYAYGGGSTILPSVLAKLGCEVIALNAYPDDTRPSRTSAETKQAFENLGTIVKSVGAHVGLMMDANAERLFFVDDQGRVIQEEQALATWIAMVSEFFPRPRIAVPVSSTHVIDEMVKRHEGVLIRTKINNRALMNAAVNDKVVFCCDNMGGMIFPEFQPAFDGIMATAKLLEFLSKSDKPLSRIVDDIPKFYLHTKNVPCPWEGKGKVMRHAMDFAKDKETQLIDGVKVFLDKKEWVLILPDPDKPFVNLTIEAHSKKRCQELLEDLLQKIEAWKTKD